MRSFYSVNLIILLAILSGSSQVLFGQSITYSSVGTYTYNVPVGVTSIQVDMAGAQGGASYYGYAGGKGGRVQCTMTVTGGSSLTIDVGGAGTNNPYYCCSSFGGGANGTGGAASGGGSGYYGPGSGGGSSDICVGSQSLANRVVVGAGGGGASFNCGDAGGVGGGTTGGNGTYCGSYNSSYSGGAGTPSAPGSGGCCATSGGVGYGGSGNYLGGGGGGGYYGGGGGYYGSGGGGSSYAASSVCSNVTNTSGYESGNGYVTICVTPTITGSVTSLCTGSTTTLTGGGSGTWSSSNSSVATVSSGLVRGVAAGTVTISYSSTTACGTSTATYAMTINQTPGTISGTSTYCSGTSATLSSSPSGGSWTSSNSLQASVNSSGVVSALSAGTPTISYSFPGGCPASVYPLVINTQPVAISGATSVCGSLTTTLADGTSGGTWSSTNTAVAPIGSSTGVVTGLAAGTATISYIASGGCFVTAPMTVNPLASIAGTPTMCNGNTTSLSDAASGGTWSSSVSSVATVNSTSGLVSSVSIGTTIISYTIGSCVATQSVAVTGVPGIFSVIGGGSYCSGGTGVSVGMAGSTAGVSYQLYNGTTPVGSPVIGAGFSFNFPPATGAGSYGVIADPGTSCATTMTGSASITINSLPTAYIVSGGGSFCSGASGVHVYLNGSAIGTNYQLFVNTGSGATPAGGAVAGTGASLDFGAQTTQGVYSVGATNTSTTCAGNMTGTVTVTINPLPTAYNVTPTTGTYCTGGSGAAIGLSNSVTGTTYQLMLGGAAVGSALSGTTGSTLNFGNQTTPGTYTVVATNTSTGCTNTMTGSSTISVSPLPTAYTMTGGGAYCSGSAGSVVGLNGSQSGVNYQLYLTGTSTGGTGLVPGTGSAISFGSETSSGSYTVVATSSAGCVSNMTGSASVTINNPPTAFPVTGGGSYCSGGTGMHVGLGGSVAGTNYQLLNGSSIVGAASGSGSSIDFGAQTAAGTYSVLATNTVTGCTGNMSGTVNVGIYPLPSQYNVTGGGAYCAGGSGYAIGLFNSQPLTTYQLLLAGVPVASVTSTGTGSISFGLQTAAGAYTVLASQPTGCTNVMTGSASVIINPLPTVFNVTGGGGYCAGTSGAHIGLSGSDIGVSYQLSSPIAPVTGVGAAINFGIISTVGTYSVTATNPTTGCSRAMSGNTTISINPLPAPFAITVANGGAYCAGGSGVAVGLANSASGVNYQLLRGITPVGSPVAGSGSNITFGPQTVAGTYTAVGTSSAGCASNMTGNITVSINPLPAVFTVSGTGSYCAGGTGSPVTLNNSVVGNNYQLNYLGVPMGTAQPGTGAPVVFGPVTGAGNYTITAINPATNCSTIMAGSATISVNPLPGLYLVSGGGNYCAGATGAHVTLAGSAIGISYQLLAGGLPTSSILPGTSVALDFGPQTTAGAYTVLATNTTTNCSQLMNGTAIVGINPAPSAHTVTGGGNYCPGGTGSVIGLNGSNTGTTYQLFNGTTAVGSPVSGTGSTISFGPQTGTGNYVVIGTNTATSCTGNMTGSVTVGLNALPTLYNATGGGNYCPGGSGVHVGLSGTSVGVNYQLVRGGTPVPGTVSGTGFALDFGLETTPGTYTIVGTSSATGCSSTMNGNSIINISALPATHNVTGGGQYCTGGTGLHVGLDGSNTGAYYQLYNGITAVGSPMAGTGLPLDFGLQATGGSYTVLATGTTTSCSNTMNGSVSVVVNPLPTSYSVMGGGNYCSGGLGSDVTLSGSDPGTNYQLFLGGTMLGSSLPGTGSALDFGLQTGSGVYMVVATNTATSCTNTSTGSVSVTTNPPPTAYVVTGGGNYCSGGAGVHVKVNGSDVGTQYQLLLGGSPVGAPMAGTGFGLDFGLQNVAGNYTVQATNTTTTCVGLMTGSANIATTALPTVYNFSASGSTYCAGGAGIDMSLSGSDLGTEYQLYNGLATVGSPLSGTGLPIDFGSQTMGGSYSVVAINTSTSCSNSMAGSAAISINPLPVAFTVTGGGSYCNGGTGVNIDLSGSNVGVTYQLLSAGSPVGGVVSGSGSSLNFGMQTGAGTYTVMATNSATGCSNTMSGSAAISINAQPSAYAVTGGGNYCAGGAGVNVGVGGSALGIHYQLLRAGNPVGPTMSGTGFALSFGDQTTTGNYTVLATNTTTGCTSTMTGNAVIGINAVPATYAVIGGGSYCPGGTGVNVGLSGSVTGISYQLFDGTTMMGAAMSGTGSPINFGLQTNAGTYTIIAKNTGTSCSSVMTGSAEVTISPLPAVFGVEGGGSYCAGGTGVHIGLNGSATGISYQLYNGFTQSGTPVIGTGGAIDLGAQTGVGTYNVIATDLSSNCTSNMTGSATITVNPVVIPAVTISTGVGDTVCSGQTTTFTAMPVNGGLTPSYQWTVNGVVASVGTSYAYVPLNGDVVGVTLTSNANCATPSSATNTIGMTVYNSEMPTVSVMASPGTEVCANTIVNFTATPAFGGSAPVYSWFKNNINVGSSSTYSYTPDNGDVVYCVLSSSYFCRLANNVQSGHLTMEVDNAVPPSVSITTNPGGTLAPGEQVTFVATVTAGGGPTPSFQWFVNSNAVPGANTSTFTTSSLVDGDSVTCQVLSSGGCAGNSGFNSVTVHVRGDGVQVVNAATSDIKLVPNPNNGSFTLKGNLGVNTDQTLTYEVTDMLGQVVYKGQFVARNGDVNEHIQLSNAANGMYMLNVHSDAANMVFHVVIEQ